MESQLFIGEYINKIKTSGYSIYNMTKLDNVVSETPKIMARENFFRLATPPWFPPETPRDLSFRQVLFTIA